MIFVQSTAMHQLNVWKRILFAISFLIPTILFAQETKLSGTVKDETGKPLALVNVILLQASDSSSSSSALTDNNGAFTLMVKSPGSYIIKLTSIGYSTKYISPVNTTGIALDLGLTTMTTQSKTLQEISVSSLRPQITQLPDRMVVSVAGTAMAAGNTAYDVLARSPGVFVDHEGNIQLNGRSGVLVTIDGKQTFLSARDLRTMLEGMTAENIKSIELITNPSSKYEAEGLSGVINIVLKKNTQRGINGSVYAGLNYNGTQWGHSIGGNINHKLGKWNSSLSIDRLRRVGGREATFTRIFKNQNDYSFFDQVAEGNFVVQGPPTIRFATDYSINSKHTIGGMIYFSRNSIYQDFLTETYIGVAPKSPLVFIDADNSSNAVSRNFTSNLRYSWKLDTLGSLLSSDLDYIRLRNTSESNFYNYYDSLSNSNDRREALYTNTPSTFDIYSGRMDLIKMFKGGKKFESGFRISKVKTDNDFQFYFNTTGLVLDPQRTNHFLYDERIIAGYINYVTDLGKKISLQAGLRIENTSSTGNLLTSAQVTKRNYTDLFPSLFIQHKVSDRYNITWSYGRRINRPNYGNLNPFRSYRDPYTYTEGNPYLRPQYSHSFNVTQTFKKSYVLILSYQLNKDFIAELLRFGPDNTTIYYNGNVDGAYNFGGTAIAPINFTKKWTSQNTLNFTYNYNRIYMDQQKLINKQLYYSLQSVHTILLPKNFRLELSGLYQGPAAYGLYQIKPRGRFDAAIRRSFFKSKLDLTLNAIDIFKTQRLKFDTRINGNINDFDQYLRPRVFGLVLRYNFSKGQKVDVKRRNAVEEVNRTGG